MKKYLTYAIYLGVLLIITSLLNYTTGKVWNFFSWITAVSGGILLLVYLVACFETVKEILSLRSVRYGGNTFAVSLILLIILGMINFIANRRNYRFDLTAGKQFSLSPQTIQVLKSLNRDVHVTAFFQSDSQQEMEDILKSYRFHSSKFSFEFIDPDRRPAIAKQYGITNYGTTVFESGGKVQKITEQEEQDLTTTLIKVTREGKKIIYFLDGHGENDIEDSERTGYSNAIEAIEEENYSVQKLILAGQKSVQEDCAVLIINGPEKALFQSELDTILAYLERGGKALFLLDPEPSYGFTNFLNKWGLEIGNNIILDVSGVGQLFGMGPSVPLVSSYESHDITRKFDVMTFFPYSRSVTPKDDEESISVQALFKTSTNSWGEADLKGKQGKFNEGEDLQGPVTLGAVVSKENNGKNTRIVVIGDSDFANNSYFSIQGNADLFLNIINWLAEEEDLISIRPKSPEDRRITMTAIQARWVMYLTVILMPITALIAGIRVYIRRERH